MSNSANIPAMGNKIVVDIPALNALLQQMIRAELANVADLPVRAKQMVEGANGWEFQQFNGSGWATLTDWNINAQQVDGHSAATDTTPNTVPVRDADGKLPGDITGNAATASKAAALSATNPIEKGGTGGATAAQARQNLGVPPISHASSATNCGIGTKSQYGHVKTHDDPDATLTAATGHALSPAGAASLKTELEEQIEEVETGASSKLSTLDTSLRALIAQEVAKCLKLTGGTMTGRITVSGTDDFIKRDVNNGRLVFLSGPDWQRCAYLELCGGDNSGHAILYAKDGTNGASFVLYPTGVAQISGREVITSAGGTMAGTLYNVHCLRNNLSGQAVFSGGTTLDNGACVVAYGQSCTEGFGYGQLLLRGADKGTVCDLIVHPHNGVLINGQRVLTLVASWRSGASWYRKWSDGFIEQGGDYRNQSDWGFNTITLHTAFATTDYFVVGQEWQYNWNSNDHKPNNMLKSKSTTSFSLETFKPGSLWYACGY